MQRQCGCAGGYFEVRAAQKGFNFYDKDYPAEAIKLGATYYLTKADYASRTQRDANTNTLQLDAEAKF